jgi:hypothetical protein
MVMKTRLACSALFVLGFLLLAQVASAQISPPTLTGEELFAHNGVAGAVATVGKCETNGTSSSTFTFTASGNATGPYPGAFTETGTFTLGPSSAGKGRVESFTASFTITSTTGQVSGEKSLSNRGGAQAGSCSSDTNGSVGNIPGDYTAQIVAEGCTYSDRGINPGMGVYNSPPLPADASTQEFSEGFRSALLAPEVQGTCAVVAPQPTTTSVKCEPNAVVAGQPTTCTATVTDTTTPEGTVSFNSSGEGSFSEASCKLNSPSGASNSCSVTYTPSATASNPVRIDTITATYGGDQAHEGSKGTTAVTVFSATALARGSFVIGDQNATIGAAVEWWGSDWWKENSLSGGVPPSAFKGFAESSPGSPMCGESWTTKPGNSSRPPKTVPEYMEVIAASKITKSGSTISGNTKEVVLVKTNPGYAPNPGHEGTGKVEAIVCKS